MSIHDAVIPPELRTQLQLLISANHILHHHGLVDAFGHISIRHPIKRTTYIIAAYDPGAPALVSSFIDLIEYHVETSEPVDKDAPRGYSERYIHGEIFKMYPEVNCVVHSHSEAVIPFTTGGMRPRPVFHMAGFLGPLGPPTVDLTGVYNELNSKGLTHVRDMLIKTPHLGSKLAEAFSLKGTLIIDGKHGFTCVGDTIQNAVYRAIYTQKNCALLRDAMGINSYVRNLDSVNDPPEISYLTEEEAKGCARMNEMTADKAFRLWLREVEVNPLYRNEEGVPKNLPVGGMRD
ncbi:class II aldolase and Adducin N-terminal domain-domain-containing protein [Clohesyomyces aquaticus]|uniref:Class II aldolase and Adducin N-terminal domain-domain-containing protein n=1 Tax=Clohesyomyces aquaticus TaxID=1231657 RepID=A0A1Y1Y8Z6_9PLEO|nr:class II aldolase and Adducin N-terminal domain-domain-containing protein [Clohesyomyces aquaticus]